MNIAYVPLMHIQRDLYRMPRDMNRFEAYLRAMTNADRSDLDLPPLAMMNPMAREHVPALIDDYLALEADRVAEEAVAGAQAELASPDGEYRIGLVVSDDLRGGWTNRHATEFGLRFPENTRARSNWLAAVLWSSEAASIQRIQEAIRTAIYRMAYIREKGISRTLRHRLAQEGWVLARSGCTEPTLEAEDLAYTREVLREFLDAGDMPTTIECMWGDEASRRLGFTPRGLSANAGLALALHDARRDEPADGTRERPVRGSMR